MQADDYQKKALRTASKMTEGDMILNGVLGLNGEAGEVADHIKKVRFQGHEMNKAHLADELGDILWYIAIMSEGLGFTLSEVMEMNVEKLKKRYPDGFSVEKSINREK